MKPNKIKAAFEEFLDSRVSRLKWQHKLGICLAVWAVPIALFYFLYFSPKSEEIGGLEKKKAGLVADIRKVEAVAKQLDKHEAEMKETERNFQAASLLLPQEKEIPSLLANISSQGTNAGLEILTFKPNREAPKEFYAEIPINIKVRGPYHNVGVFLDKVRKLPRLVSVHQVKMGGPKKVDGEMFLETTLDLVTYRFIEPGTGEDAKKDTKKKKGR